MKQGTVIICGQPYSLVFAEKPGDVDPSEEEMLYGRMDFRSRTITVSTTIGGRTRSKLELLTTITHEILHGIFQHDPLIENTLKNDVCREDWIESMSTLVSAAIYDALPALDGDEDSDPE